MELFQASFFVALLVVLASTSPSPGAGYSASSSKYIKIKENEKNRNITIHKKSEVTVPGQSQASSFDGEDESDDLSPQPGDTVQVSEVTENYVYEEISCISPHPRPLENHAAFAEKLLSHRAFYPLGSSYFYNRVSQSLTGKMFHENDKSKACFRGISASNSRRIHGFGSKAVIPCKGDILDSTCVCNAGNKEASDLRITSVLSDGVSYVLMVSCSSKLDKGSWSVASNKRELSPESKKKIIDKISSLGFDSSDVVELCYKACDQAIPSDAFEGPCEEEIPGVPRKDYKKVLAVLEKGVYTPFSSTANVYALAMFLRGERLKEDEDMDKMCAKHHWSPARGEVTSRGFNHKKSMLSCDLKDLGNIQCTPDDEYGDNRKVYVYNKNIRPIWTDGQKYLLTYNCLSTNAKAWALYSTEPKVDEATRKYVLSKVADVGFDPLKARVNNYGACEILKGGLTESNDGEEGEE